MSELDGELEVVTCASTCRHVSHVCNHVQPLSFECRWGNVALGGSWVGGDWLWFIGPRRLEHHKIEVRDTQGT